jgi:hypothetical protein
MTEAAAAAPKNDFRPIYPATVVPGEIKVETSVKGKPYLVIPNSTVTGTKSGKTLERTVMVFGKSVDAVTDMLKTGVPVELAVQRDNGTIKIIGPVLEPKKKAQA